MALRRPDARIEKMRALEDKLSRIQAAVKETNQQAAYAHFEARTDQRIKDNEVMRRFQQLRARKLADLDARRARLAQKLLAEDNMYKEELIQSQETPEQRRERISNRARQLATVREAERQQLADELMSRAFEENCEPLRAKLSTAIVYRTAAERDQQIDEKMARKIVEAEEKRLFDEMYEVERLKKEQRYLDDKRKQREDNAHIKATLDDQVRLVAQRRADEKEAARVETQALQALWAQMEAQAAAEDAAERERLRGIADDVRQFNEMKKMQLSAEERAERELDLKYLQEALAREAAEELHEQTLRDRRRDEARRYREQLVLMMQKQAEDNADRDAMIEAANRAQQAKEDAERGARDEARRRLMAEVDAIRQQQMAEKAMRKQLGNETKALERLQLESEAAAEEAAADAKRLAARRSLLEQKLDNYTQMMAKAHMRKAEADEKVRAQEQARQAEAEYQSRVAQALNVGPKKWHGYTKPTWFD